MTAEPVTDLRVCYRSSGTVAEACGITYRQLDYWVRCGYLHPVHRGGSGHDRLWPYEEIATAVRMGLLVAAGLTPRGAHAVTRAGRCDQVLEILKEVGL